MNKNVTAFLTKLADLCEQYKIEEIGYTRDDDGVHIVTAGMDICVGNLGYEGTNVTPALVLREFVSKLT